MPRVKLCLAAKQTDGLLDAAITDLVQFRSSEASDKAKARLIEHDLMRPRIREIEMSQYKHVIDIDGNVNAWGLFTKLLMGCCVLKVGSIWRQWYL